MKRNVKKKLRKDLHFLNKWWGKLIGSIVLYISLPLPFFLYEEMDGDVMIIYSVILFLPFYVSMIFFNAWLDGADNQKDE